MKTIALIGGSGFVGSHLCNHLVNAGYRVRVFTRRRSRCKHLLVYPSLEIRELDVHCLDELQANLQGCDVVINLVGILNESASDNGNFQQVHVNLTEKLIKACWANKVSRVFQMSALHADAESGPSQYLFSKGEAEKLLLGSSGFALTIFRPSVIFGDGDSFFNRFASLLRLSPLIFPLACANARFAPVHVNDVCAAFVYSLKHKDTIGKTYELCGPYRYTLKTLVTYTATQLGLNTIIIELPDIVARIQARLLEWVPGNPFTRDNYQSLQIDSICSQKKPGFSELDIKPGSLETIVPVYLSAQHQRGLFHRFRKHAGRSN